MDENYTKMEKGGICHCSHQIKKYLYDKCTTHNFALLLRRMSGIQHDIFMASTENN